MTLILDHDRAGGHQTAEPGDHCGALHGLGGDLRLAGDEPQLHRAFHLAHRLRFLLLAPRGTPGRPSLRGEPTGQQRR